MNNIKKTDKKNTGITVIELLITISIIGILSSIIFLSLSKFRNQQNLRNTAEDIATLLNNARNSTLSSLNSTNYSVHIESHRAVLFTGSTFIDPNATNVEIDFDSSVLVPASGGINLNGSGSDVIYNRLTGDTSDYGTIIEQQASDSTKQITITIKKTGIVSTN